MYENGFLDVSIGCLIDMYKKGEITPTEIAHICIDRVNKLESTYDVWEYFDKDILLEQAKEAEMTMSKSNEYRLLEGIPVGVKDIINTNDFPTQMGSPIWKGFTPGNDARVIYNIKRQGGVVAGKTGTAEFAVHTVGKTKNPHDVNRTPGTSSSGSAVGVALGMFPTSIGTQTAGSIIRPASFCGVYGYKPSFGLVPRTGMLKTTDSLDSIGYFVAHSEDLERVFNSIIIKGNDYPISNSILNDEERQNKNPKKPWRVVFVKTHTWEYAYEYAKDSIIGFINKLSSVNDIEIVEKDLPESMKNSHVIHENIYNKCLSHYFKEEYKQSKLVSPIMNELIENGMKVGLDTFNESVLSQTILAKEMDEFLKDYDIMISLSTAGEAPMREIVERPDSALMWSLTHLPVANIPAFISPNGNPFGMQFVARRYNDLLLFNFIKYLTNINLIPSKPYPLLEL